MKIAVIIPALNPDDRLLALVAELKQAADLGIIVVDDGSLHVHRPLFDRLESEYGCAVCRHGENRGKGAAIKSGLREAARIFEAGTGYITADADGQHSPEDILRVGMTLQAYPDCLILGSRTFSGRDVPFNSRWGNRITSLVFYLCAGMCCSDTQTGLRGISASFARECEKIKGERFEYEMNMLLEAAMRKIPFVEAPIRTIYMENNRSSHFNPIRDSVRIYGYLLKFGMSSLFSAAVDIAAFTLLAKLVFGTAAKGILIATVIARAISGGLNFLLNKRWVFAVSGSLPIEVAKYLTLFCGQMLASWLLVSMLVYFSLPLLPAKLLTDGGLFFLSYRIQGKYIFKAKQNKR